MIKTDKVVMIGSIVVAAVLLYMIRPAETIAYCTDWKTDLRDKFESVDRQLNAIQSTAEQINYANQPTEEELVTEWSTLQRAGLLYAVVCGSWV